MHDLAISYAHLGNLSFVEELYTRYKQDPSQVDSSWRYFFEGMEFAYDKKKEEPSAQVASSDLQVYLLIEAYRTFGYMAAHIDPINMKAEKEPDALSLQHFGFSGDALSQEFSTFGLLGKQRATLGEIIEALRKAYCGTLSIEYMGICDEKIKKFIQEKVEPSSSMQMNQSQKLAIWHFLNKAELFESFIHTKYVGQKRFSLEGAESLIPLLAFLLDKGSELGLEQATIGMAHRGRLNVLANILNKSYTKIFYEFEDHYSPMVGEGTGDVKYHKGFQGELSLESGRKIHITLSANPSHLESVDPLVEGMVRAQQELKALDTKKALAILIHGDSSVAGQGIVYETLQMSRLQGYSTGGTVHIVVNNQIGFTTIPSESRSTRYCTDIAKAFSCPVLHVNAEDPEACVKAALLAIELRQQFGCDVFIDLNCYRKYGHNEGDEPTFTQPLLYKVIKEKKTIRQIYKEHLLASGELSEDSAKAKEEEFKQSLAKAMSEIPSANLHVPDETDYYTESGHVDAQIPQQTGESLKDLTRRFCAIPNGFELHPKIAKLFSDRLKAIEQQPMQKVIDWGFAEHLAFASLLTEGVHIRLSGQDCQRGTFSQRHAAWVDQKSTEKHFPLRHLSSTQAPFEVLNSPLSEYAVLGFDLGYSLTYPKTLTLWEAQYGDFANTAQVIIDQYISSFEQKWKVSSNITLLLPHGYEGQGPEHSSARMERYLQLCAQDNIIIANCTLPSQYFHLLRRQAYLSHKKPLVVFSPKALLRHPRCLSALSDFTERSFQEVLEDPVEKAPSKVLLCTGKVYFDLLAEKEKRSISDLLIIRIEQLYPFPKEAIAKVLSKYPSLTKAIWVQEEHSNMGPWEFVRPQLEHTLPKGMPLHFAGRPRSAATATGSYSLHKKQFQKMIDEAFS